jgi:hypothetical protein
MRDETGERSEGVFQDEGVNLESEDVYQYEKVTQVR